MRLRTFPLAPAAGSLPDLAASGAPPLSAEAITALRAHRWDRDWPIP